MGDRALIILVVLVLLHAWLTWKDVREYRVFRQFERSGPRRDMLRTWLRRSVIWHGLAAVVVLIGLGRADALLHLPPELAAAAAAVRPTGDGFPGGLLRGMATALPVALLILPTALTVIDIRRRSARGERLRDDPAVQARNTASLFPRNPAERRLMTLVSLNAGVSEELFFRLLLPVLIVLAGGGTLAAMLLATLAFGLAHLYQGWTGVLGTTLFGGVLLFVYLFTGQLWLVILIHALLDLNGLALAPWLEARWLGEEAGTD